MVFTRKKRERTDLSRSSPCAPAQLFITKSLCEGCSHDWQHKHQFVHWKMCECSIAVPAFSKPQPFWSPVHRHSSILGADSCFQTLNLEQKLSTEMSRHDINGMMWGGEDCFSLHGQELSLLVKQHKLLSFPLWGKSCPDTLQSP